MQTNQPNNFGRLQLQPVFLFLFSNLQPLSSKEKKRKKERKERKGKERKEKKRKCKKRIHQEKDKSPLAMFTSSKKEANQNNSSQTDLMPYAEELRRARTTKYQIPLSFGLNM
eukprot:TRINITY_DN422_c0_g2_i1.p2 TRINITY_DN422_c0_g2~~TRINITY_DN422_c0_g2_i1.p2  ORF type:complete len:113 (-),score=41.29 TRINITY_DN422_c0_g2_i1:192-530(-)